MPCREAAPAVGPGGRSTRRSRGRSAPDRLRCSAAARDPGREAAAAGVCVLQPFNSGEGLQDLARRRLQRRVGAARRHVSPDGACRVRNKNTANRYLEILSFQHSARYMIFKMNGSDFKNKVLMDKIESFSGIGLRMLPI